MQDFKLFHSTPEEKRTAKVATFLGVVLIGVAYGLLMGWRG